MGYLCAFALLIFTGQLTAQNIVVHPKLIDDVLVNPGMGIQTFQRFNGDALNAGLEWSEEGPVGPILRSTQAPDFPPSTISYCRWFWATIEPEKGKIRWDILDSALAEAARHGQTLDIRLMPYDQKHPLPVWYQQSGAKRMNQAGDKIWEPDFSDPLYLRHWGDLVRDAGKRYDGDVRLDAVDISSVGYWGEGWSEFMPAFAVQKKLIDIWIEAFPATHLLMNFDEPEALHYGTGRGAGWRLDCVGDMRQKWSHMLDFYPEQMVRAGIQDSWKQSPVSLETCGVPGSWKKQGWDVNYILAESLRWHVTSMNVKSSAIPADWKPAFDALQKRMGYRLELRRFEYPPAMRAGKMIPVKMWWVNSGVAPLYRPYVLALQWMSESRQAIVEFSVDTRKWLPGDALLEDAVPVPNLPAGNYTIRVALLDPATRRPAIQLGIAGKRADGWYELGSVRLE